MTRMTIFSPFLLGKIGRKVSLQDGRNKKNHILPSIIRTGISIFFFKKNLPELKLTLTVLLFLEPKKVLYAAVFSLVTWVTLQALT